MKINKRSVDIYFSIFLIAIAIFLIYLAKDFKPQARYFPLVVLTITLFLCLIIIIQKKTSRKDKDLDHEQFEIHRHALIQTTKLSFGIIFYILCIPILGFFSTTAILLPIISYLMGYKTKKVLFLSTFAFLLVLFLVFKLLLQVPLPEEAIINLISG